MSEKRILIASLLKPVNDTRMYEKLGNSLAKLPQVQVHIAGFQAPLPPQAPASLSFHPLFSFKRLSFGRLGAQLAYFRLLQKLQPHLIIACTHELLVASHWYCRTHACQLVYDVQENYTLNLTSQRNYAGMLRYLLAWGVGMAERWVAPHVAHFLVAEQSYVQELRFLGNRYTLLENKYKPNSAYPPPPTPVRLGQKPLRLLYSGTIAEIYGVFEAVALAEQLHRVAPDTTLTIIGYCADKNTYTKVWQQVQERPYIQLIGGNQLVPHGQIIKAIQESTVGLLPYRPHESTFRCIPTKLYEYAAHGLPMLAQHNPLWADFLSKNQAGLSIDFANADAMEVCQDIRNTLFYKPGVPSGVFWESEEIKLQRLIQQLLQQQNN
ncbi:glycosyltransferase family protein [Pontibacter sp. CAU 1760]